MQSKQSTDAAAMAGSSIGATRIKKVLFFGPGKCPIDPFGPVANRAVLKRLHGALLRSHSTGSSARVLQRRSDCSVAEVLANRALPHNYVRPL